MPFANSEDRREYERDYWSKNRTRAREKHKRWYLKHREIAKERAKKYRDSNKDRFRRYSREYRQSRYATDLNFRLREILRCRLNSALKNNSKQGSAVKDLGCSIEEFKLYIENYFNLYPGMSWNNYGDEWELDHFQPLSSFDLTNNYELKEACHWTNLQPLPILENRSKSNAF